MRWVSIEPMLGPVDLSRHRQGLKWVVVGGESGPHARPMHPDWVRSLRDQCIAENVSFYLKQWGEWAPDCLCETKQPHRTTPRPKPGKVGVLFHCGRKNAGDELDGEQWHQIPDREHICQQTHA